MKILLTEKQIEKIALEIKARSNYNIILPSFGLSLLDDISCVTVENNYYYHFYKERGERKNEKFTSDLNELMFWIFENPTSRIAYDYELRHRIKNQDSRIIAFRKHLEILEQLKLDQKYINELKIEYSRLLKMEL